MGCLMSYLYYRDRDLDKPLLPLKTPLPLRRSPSFPWSVLDRIYSPPALDGAGMVDQYTKIIDNIER